MSPRIFGLVLLYVGFLPFSQSSIQAEDRQDAVTPDILKPPPSTLDPNQQPKRIDPLSVRPLLLIQLKGSEPIGTATGFVVKKNRKNYLITNQHVVTGRDPQTDSLIRPDKKTPDRIIITYHGQTLGTWLHGEESLFDSSFKKRWLEHRDRGVDVVALPIESAPHDAHIYSFDLSLSDADIMPEVAMPVSIIGFPLRLTRPGNFPIWKTGHIASDPELDFGGEPLFLIDATTRSGMSGSPVVLRLSGRYRTRTGKIIMSSSGIQTLFLGVYSGRLSQESEIGRVWKPIVIKEILP